MACHAFSQSFLMDGRHGRTDGRTKTTTSIMMVEAAAMMAHTMMPHAMEVSEERRVIYNQIDS